MAQYKVLYTDTCFPDMDVELKALAEADAEIVTPKGIDEDSLIEAGQGCVGILVDYAPITRKVLEGIPSLKVVSRQGIGYNNVDVEAASALGICVANVPDYCRDEVSDHAVALYLSCIRQTVFFNGQVKAGIWDITPQHPILRIRGRKFGLYGLGGIARKVAEKLKGFGVNLYAFDPYLPDEVFEKAGVKRAGSLEELFEDADAVSLHAPLNRETEGSINMHLFKKMSRNGIIINTSRGPLINEEDLADALEQGIIAGAGLDVLVNEPPEEGNRLIRMENVIFTPHVAYASTEADEELRRRTAEEVVNVIKTGYPQDKAFVNKKAFNK